VPNFGWLWVGISKYGWLWVVVPNFGWFFLFWACYG